MKITPMCVLFVSLQDSSIESPIRKPNNKSLGHPFAMDYRVQTHNIPYEESLTALGNCLVEIFLMGRTGLSMDGMDGIDR